MIPQTLHYCWFGHKPLPPLAQQCIATWQEHMPTWRLQRWDEGNFDPQRVPYTAEAYAAEKYAFVSDYVRLWVLSNYGGVYLDVDFCVLQSFAPLMHHHAFAGFEGSKHLPLRAAVIGSEAHGQWIDEMLHLYDDLHFALPDGRFDLTTNVQRLSAHMSQHGFIQNGKEQDYKDLHIYPVEYFSPHLTTGEYRPTEHTFAEHTNLGSWHSNNNGWKETIRQMVGQRNMTRLIKLKRKLLG
ncbi:MAG: hypothetical protein IJ761_06060 [Bacteroidales bacterium]|nr:hypothetical protein [Bacteroidales bacterium]MBR1799446.1 hypothetical protein [Bacteroidales bacterium]